MRAEQTLSRPAPHAMRAGLARLSRCASYDLVGLAVLALLLPVLVQLPLPLLRVPLGLVLVLLAPGYVLTAALFARRDDLDRVSRAAMSFGASAALIPIFALVLDRLPWGIRLWPMVLCLSAWLLVGCGVAAVRRWRSGTAVNAPQWTGLAPWLWSEVRRAKLISLLVIGLALVMVAWAGSLPISYTERPALTEFYVLGAGGLVEDYPRQAAPGELMQVLVGVTNQEAGVERYRIEMRGGGHLLSEVDWFSVDQQATWRQTLHYALAQPGRDQAVDILLFSNRQAEPYRHLRLWVDIVERTP